MRALAVLAVAAVTFAGRSLHAGMTADIAMRLENEKSECGFLIQLCRQASRLREQAAPAAGRAGLDTLRYKYERESEMRTDEAVDAARALVQKHHGKKLWCFAEPECEFLADEMRRAP